MTKSKLFAEIVQNQICLGTVQKCEETHTTYYGEAISHQFTMLLRGGSPPPRKKTCKIVMKNLNAQNGPKCKININKSDSFVPTYGEGKGRGGSIGWHKSQLFPLFWTLLLSLYGQFCYLRWFISLFCCFVTLIKQNDKCDERMTLTQKRDE